MINVNWRQGTKFEDVTPMELYGFIALVAGRITIVVAVLIIAVKLNSWHALSVVFRWI
jgi:hypothetical protein